MGAIIRLMFTKFRAAFRLQPFFLLSLISAACFNNWALGFLLNPTLLRAGGSISELSSSDQSHFAVFRTLDILAGLMLVSMAIWWQRSQSRQGHDLIFWGALILGVANTADALLPLNCSETLNPSCSMPISLSLHHIALPGHAYSSTAIGLGYFLLPLGGWLYARRYNLRTFLLASQLVLALNLLFFASILHEYATVGITVKASGWLQAIQMLAVGTWLFFWGRSPEKMLRE